MIGLLLMGVSSSSRHMFVGATCTKYVFWIFSQLYASKDNSPRNGVTDLIGILLTKIAAISSVVIIFMNIIIFLV